MHVPAHGPGSQTEDRQEIEVSTKFCPGSPSDSVLTHGDTLLLSNSRHVLMQEIIWLYNPVLAVKMWQQRVR